jgi:hypothetical protein
MPGRSCVDPLSSALAAPEASACLRNEDHRGQGVHVYVGLMPATEIRRDDGVNAFLAHVAPSHGRAKGRFHAVVALTAPRRQVEEQASSDIRKQAITIGKFVLEMFSRSRIL